MNEKGPNYWAKNGDFRFTTEPQRGGLLGQWPTSYNVKRCPASPLTRELNFNGHIKTICRRPKITLKLFQGLQETLTIKKASLLYNSLILTNFSYCPLMWMFCGKTANEEVNRVHKRALRVLLNDFASPFEELLHVKDL